ncbi:MAG: hypothetical protein ACKVU4_06640 [Phycisphaerales bacterium]
MTARRTASSWAAAAACAIAPAPATAQESAEQTVPPAVGATRDAWTVRLEPAAWYAAPGGEFQIPGSSTSRLPADHSNMDSPRFAPFGEVHVAHDRYGFYAGAVVFNAEDRGWIALGPGTIGGVAFSAGDELTTTLDFVSAEAAGYYRLYRRPRGERKFGGFLYEPTWDVLVGARLYDVGLDVAAPAGVSSNDSFFAEPYVGLRFSMDLIEEVTVDVQATVGYFYDGADRRSTSWDIIAGFQWNPSPNFGMQAGYRQLAFLLHDGDGSGAFEFNGALAGLYLGGTLRF